MARRPNDEDSNHDTDVETMPDTLDGDNKKNTRGSNAKYRFESDSDLVSSGSDYQPDDAPIKNTTASYHTGSKTRQTTESVTSDRDLSDQASSKGDKPSNQLSKRRGKKRQVVEEEAFGDEDEDEHLTNGILNSISDTFSLFFESNPSGLDADFNDRTIGFQEIRAAADKLGENLTDEEIQEMLDYASLNKNSRVTIQAFEKLINEIRTV